MDENFYVNVSNTETSVKNINTTSIGFEESKIRKITRIEKIFKRTADIVGSLCGIVLLVPITLGIKIANIINKDYGPVFYVQNRIGKDGKVFKMYKYRSMVVDADKKLKTDLLVLNERICKVRAFFTLVEDTLLNITYLVSAIALILSLYLMAPYYAQGKVSGACYVLLGIISFSMFEAVFPLALSFTKFAEVKHAFNEINALMNLPKDQKEQGKDFNESLQSITFNNVSFTYSKESPLLINKFSASFVNSKNYALCADVGSGKTTLVYLMTSLLKDYSGTILLNEKDLKSFSGSSVRKCFSVAPQSNDFFSGTILDSFKEVNPHIDENSIFKVLDEVELTDFVKNLPLGIHQFLGNNGLLLSGGQARRLVLARALCRNCDFLILDEPGEGLDVIQEQRILKRILCSRKGVILISHKGAGLNFCDEIIRI